MTATRILGIAATLLLASACTTTAPVDNPNLTAPPPTSVDPVATAPGTGAPASTEAPNASPGTAEIEWDYGTGTFDLPAPAANLSKLASYRATLVISFEGTESGLPSQWTNTHEMISLDGGADRQFTIATAGDESDGSAEPVYRAEINDVAYESVAGAACTSAAIHDADSLALRWEPAASLSGVTGAVAAGEEAVNGVHAARYTFDERAFGSLPPAETTGEMWVASDGGYVVRYQLTTTGGAEYFGEGSEGTLTLDYELTNIYGSPSMALPEDCQAALDVALLADASDVVRAPDLVSYATASTPEEVIAFYQEQLPALGWEQTADPTLEEPEAFVSFTRDGEQLSVLVGAGDAGSLVRVIVAPVVVAE